MSPPTRPLVSRLLEKIVVDAETSCWVWQASLDRDGYGELAISRERMRRAHRLSYELFVGQIPCGLQIDHLCRNRACVNPQHLEPVTPRENTLRGTGPSSINAKKTHCPQGHVYDGMNCRGNRTCSACQREADRRYKTRQRVLRTAR